MRFALALTCLTYTSLATADLNLKLPDMDLSNVPSSASSALGGLQDQQQGLALLRDLRSSRPLIEDPELCDAINALGQRLAARSPNSVGKLYFVIENNNLVNAYTLTGGVIVINSGLILNTQSESELAAVMAHEIAHVAQRHIARMQEETKNSPLIAGLGVLAGAAVASQSPDAAQAIVSSTLALQAHQQIVFTQQAEAEADRVGLRILANAHFNTEAMPYFLEKLERSESSRYGDVTKYLSTHPMSIDRLSDTRSLVNQLPKLKPSEDANYASLRERLRIITGQTATPLLANTLKSSSTAYAQAFQALRSGNPAASLTANLVGWSGLILQAQALNQLKRYGEAERRLQGLANQASTQAALTLALAESQLGQNKPALALQTLSRLVLSETIGLEFFEDAQRLAQQANAPADASFYNGSRSLRLGEYAHAVSTAEQALKLPNSSVISLRNLRNLKNEAERQLLNTAQHK